MSLFTLREVRQIVAERPPGPEGDETLDELLDLIADDFADLWPRAPEGVAFHFAAAQVSMAMKLGGLGDDLDGGGGRGPRKPAPSLSPEPVTTA